MQFQSCEAGAQHCEFFFTLVICHGALWITVHFGSRCTLDHGALWITVHFEEGRL